MEIVASRIPTVDSLSRPYRRKEINLRPPYQRRHEGVWTPKKKRLLIDSILRNYDIPKLYFREVESHPDLKYEVVDGQQRIRTIWEFLDGEFELGEESGDLPHPLGNLAGKCYEELGSETKDRIAAFPLSIFVIQRADEEEIRDLFQRLQEGTSLNPAERRNAMTGGMRDFVAATAGSDANSEPHSVLPLTRLPNQRFYWDDLVSLVTCLELAEGPANIKAPDLRRMYRDHDDFNRNGSKARSVISNLNYLARALKQRPPEMDIKSARGWG